MSETRNEMAHDDDEWKCPACGHINDPWWDHCDNCGADRDGIIPPKENEDEDNHP